MRLSEHPPSKDTNIFDFPTQPKSARRKTANNHGDEMDVDEEEESSEEEFLMKVEEYSASFLWATVDFLVLRPVHNVWTKAYVYSQNESHIILDYLNAFKVTILKLGLPREWTWVSDAATISPLKKKQNIEGDDGPGSGYYVDADGNPVEGEITFRIRDYEMRAKRGDNKGFFGIQGSLLTEQEERGREQEDEEKRGNRAAKRAKKGILRVSEGKDGHNQAEIAVEDEDEHEDESESEAEEEEGDGDAAESDDI